MAGPKHLSQFSPDILKTDFVPDEKTALSICDAMVQQEEEMKRIEEVIHGLETRICELRAQQDSIKRSHNVNRALLASERKLPPEMLSEVFRHYLDPGVYTYHENQLLLMRVCRRWRRIAAGTPSLWTSIVLEFWSQLNPCEVIRMVLANSGALPVTARVFSGNWSWDDAGQSNMQEAIRLLVENFHRFRHFMQDDYFYRELLAFGHENVIHAPLLESFHICCENDVAPPWPTTCIRAPRLKTISLPHILLMDLISFNPTYLCDVTLNINEAEVPSSLNFLASCSNIRSLHLRACGAIRPPDIEGRSRILLPCLKTLIIAFHDGNDPSTFLRTIEIPALQKFSITTVTEGFLRNSGVPLNAATFDSLFGHNHPLQELKVNVIRLDNAPLFASQLARLRNLRCLTILSFRIDDCILTSLTPDGDERASDWNCPSLTELDVSHSVYSLDLLLRLVRSRARTDPEATISGGAYLQCVHARGRGDRDAFVAALDNIRKSCGGHLRVICD